MGCASKTAVILFLAHPCVGLRRDDKPGPYYVGEGEECNGTLPPEHAKLCNKGFECSTSGLLGAGGICKKKAKGPYYVGEGEKCSGALPPQYVTLCKEGFKCATSGLAGAGGICKKVATEAESNDVKTKGPYYVDEGEECNGSLPPEHAKLCKEGFECATSDSRLAGAGGTCKKIATKAEGNDVKTKGPYYVDEGEECNGSLPPEHAKLCKEGFECATSDSRLAGAGGTCKKIATKAEGNDVKTKGPYYVDEGEECNGSLPPEHAKLCKEGFECATSDSRLAGASGICKRAQDDTSENGKGKEVGTPVTPVRAVAAQGEKCGTKETPWLSTRCEEGLECILPKKDLQPGMHGTCKKQRKCEKGWFSSFWCYLKGLFR